MLMSINVWNNYGLYASSLLNSYYLVLLVAYMFMVLSEWCSQSINQFI